MACTCSNNLKHAKQNTLLNINVICDGKHYNNLSANYIIIHIALTFQGERTLCTTSTAYTEDEHK